MGEVERELKANKLFDDEVLIIAQYLLERRNFHAGRRKSFEVPEYFAQMTPNEKRAFFGEIFYDRVEREVTRFLNEEIFEKSEYFITEAQRKAVINTVCGLYSHIICPYANSASLTIDTRDKKYFPEPFSKGAMRKIVITKEIGADGSYNTKYSSTDSGLVVIYDKNGNVVMDNVGKGNDFAVLAQGLWKRGYNWTYLERGEVWFGESGADGKTPEQTVTGYTILPRTDGPAMEAVAELEGLVKNLSKEEPIVEEGFENSDVIEPEVLDSKIEDDKSKVELQAIKNLDWELQPKPDDISISIVDFCRERLNDCIKTIQSGEKLLPSDAVTLDNDLAYARESHQTMIDAWAKLCKECPEAYEYLPTKYFQGENCPAISIVECARDGVREELNKKTSFSPADIERVSSLADMLDKKNEVEQKKVTEFELEQEKQNKTRDELLDKINKAGLFK